MNRSNLNETTELIKKIIMKIISHEETNYNGFIVEEVDSIKPEYFDSIDKEVDIIKPDKNYSFSEPSKNYDDIKKQMKLRMLNDIYENINNLHYKLKHNYVLMYKRRGFDVRSRKDSREPETEEYEAPVKSLTLSSNHTF